MRKVINGLRYDTEKSEVIASDRYWDGRNWERRGRNTYLYKTVNNRYFIYTSTNYEGEIDMIEPLSIEEAKSYYENLPVQEVEYSEAFNEDVPEA